MLRVATAARAICAAVVVSLSLFAIRAMADSYSSYRQYGDGPVHRFAPDESRQGVGWQPQDPLVSLGERLFFDTRLSATGTTACASCHEPRYAYAERRRVSISDNGRRGRRNAPSLLNTGFFPALMWDGRFRALEPQALDPFNRGEMGIGVDEAVRLLNSDSRYLDLFGTAIGIRPTAGGMARALAAFQRTLVSRENRVDLFLADNRSDILRPIEKNGFDIFDRRAGCSRCHQLFPLRREGRDGNRLLLTDFQFHNLGVGYGPSGLTDVGRYEYSPFKPDWGAFRTPSLRTSARTPPYMHDGSLATLEDVIEFYNAGGRPNANLSPLIRPLSLDGYEKAALVAFLRAVAE